jgi:hypothetical protein
MFHAFTGCDSTSSFKFKGKRYCCKVMKVMPHLMQHFASVAETPFQTSRSLMETINEFVCKLYSSSDVPENDVNKLRMRIFFTKDMRCRTNSTHYMDALEQHTTRSVFQATVWTSAHNDRMNAPNPGKIWMGSGGWKIVPCLDNTVACKGRVFY